MSPEQQLGAKWEVYAVQMLRSHGYRAKLNPDFFSKSVDIICNGLPVEVKFANRTFRTARLTDGSVKFYPRWQWKISATAARHKEDWVAILIARSGDNLYHYVVPGALLKNRSQVQLTSLPDKYSGWLSPWLEQWQLIHFLSQKLYKSGLTYRQWLLTLHPQAVNFSNEVAKQRLQAVAVNG